MSVTHAGRRGGQLEQRRRGCGGRDPAVLRAWSVRARAPFGVDARVRGRDHLAERFDEARRWGLGCGPDGAVRGAVAVRAWSDDARASRSRAAGREISPSSSTRRGMRARARRRTASGRGSRASCTT